jgi:hypothetical protein
MLLFELKLQRKATGGAGPPDELVRRTKKKPVRNNSHGLVE